MEKSSHIAIVSSPGMGHLIPMVEFAKRLITKNNLSVTFIILNDGSLAKYQLGFLDSLPNAIDYLLLPSADFQEDVKNRDAHLSHAMTFSLLLHLPTLDQMVSGEYKDMPAPIHIPGCMPMHGKYFLDLFQDRKNDAYKLTLHNAKRYMLVDGIVINSFKELEGGAIEALQQ
nr:hydroquinone glucosyltransferase-like [Tanacetum cinerariifolium]